MTPLEGPASTVGSQDGLTVGLTYNKNTMAFTSSQHINFGAMFLFWFVITADAAGLAKQLVKSI